MSSFRHFHTLCVSCFLRFSYPQDKLRSYVFSWYILCETWLHILILSTGIVIWTKFLENHILNQENASCRLFNFIDFPMMLMVLSAYLSLFFKVHEFFCRWQWSTDLLCLKLPPLSETLKNIFWLCTEQKILFEEDHKDMVLTLGHFWLFYLLDCDTLIFFFFLFFLKMNAGL